MLSMIVLGIFVFLLSVFMIILILETISSAADAEKRRKKQIASKTTNRKTKKEFGSYSDSYFEKFDRRI